MPMFVTKRLAQMTRGGIAGFLAVLVLAGVVGFFWVARTINTAPAQCATCHPELTAMWERSQGHPADRVTCYQCHAQHAELPRSANLGAFVRDQLIPEKYLSSDERIEERCEGCHREMRSSGTGLAALGARLALQEAAATAAGLGQEERRAVVPRAVLDPDADPVRAAEVGAAAARNLRDREWVAAVARASGEGAEAALAEVRRELQAVLGPLGSAGMAQAELSRRMGTRIGERVQQIEESARRVGDLLAGPEADLAAARPAKPVPTKLAASVRAALEEVSTALGELSKARISVGRALKSEQAVADPAELKAHLGELEEALGADGTAGAALEAVRAARASLATPLPNREVIAERIAALSGEGEARLLAVLGRLRAAVQAAYDDLPAGPVPQAGVPVSVTDAALRTAAGELRFPGVAGPAEPRPDPAALAEAALAGVESLSAAVAAIGDVGYGDLGLDGERLSALADRLRDLAEAFPQGDEAAAARARLRRSLEEAVRLLPQLEAEDGLVLELAVPEPAGDGPAQVDLGQLMPAAAAALSDLERSLEKRRVIKANHKVHLVSARDEMGRPLGLGCLDCHRNLAHDKAQVETNRPTMAGCFTGECHRKDRNKDNCHRCHYQRLVEPGQEVL